MPPDDEPEQNRQDGRPQPEPELNNTANAQNAQNESDFPKATSVTAAGWRMPASTQPRRLPAC
eukprot:6218988-Alexandrium_andersonii.AAC.1